MYVSITLSIAQIVLKFVGWRVGLQERQMIIKEPECVSVAELNVSGAGKIDVFSKGVQQIYVVA